MAKGVGHDVSLGVNVLGLSLTSTSKGGEGMGHTEEDIKTGLAIHEEEDTWGAVG